MWVPIRNNKIRNLPALALFLMAVQFQGGLVHAGPVQSGPVHEGEFWWIENVSVWIGDPGVTQIVDGADVVLKDGVIVAAGVGIPAPRDAHLARRIDGSGLLLLPAFLDAYSTLGVTRRSGESRSDGRPQARNEGPPVRTWEALRRGIYPERSTVDVWNPTPDVLRAHRERGFTALAVGEEGASLSGRLGLIALGGGPLRSEIIEPRLGQGAAFSRGRGGYPASLMGSIAQLRQTLSDAHHYRVCRDLYESQPRGISRPPYDEALSALGDLVLRNHAAFWKASGERDIRRALALATEFQFRVIITGGREAYLVKDELRQAGAGVIFVEDHGEEPKVEDKEDRPPLRVQEDSLERWKREVASLAELQKAGLTWAYGSGERDGAKLLANVKLHVAAGLEPRHALRALTLGAAELLGVGATLGSIEPGKQAHLVLRERSDDPQSWFDEQGIRRVFIDGASFEREPPKPPAENEAEGDKPESAESKPAESKEEPKKANPKKEETTPADDAKPGPQPRSELRVDRIPQLVTGGDVLVRGGTALFMTGRAPEQVDVRIVKGLIEAIDTELEPLEGMKVIDASGWFVMPGIVDCHSHIGIDGGSNEGTETITCEVRIADVLNPDHIGYFRTLAGGCTSSNILHGSANSIGGQNQVVRNLYLHAPGELPFPGAPPGVKFALGENVRRRGASGRFPRSRMGVEAVFRRAFEEAKEYRRRTRQYAESRIRGERVFAPRRDLRLEALVEILDGRRWVHTHCYRADEILMILEVAKDYGFKLATLQHVLEGYKVAPEIAAQGVGASTFSDWWAYKLEAFDAIPHNPALLTRSGVVTSVNSDDQELARHLNLEAAKSVRSGGLSHEEALRLVTINPAIQLGIDGKVGSLEVGKFGDIAIFDAHPLSIFSKCRYTLVGGEVLFERRDSSRGLKRALPRAPRREPIPKLEDGGRDAVYVLRGGSIFTAVGKTVASGTVIFAGGKIQSVGEAASIKIPEGAIVIDTKNLRVFPGFIDAGSSLGLVEIESVPGSVDTREIGTSQPDLLAVTGVNAHSELIPVVRAGGVTSSAIFFRGPRISGQAGWIRHTGTSTREMVYKKRIALHVSLPKADSDGAKDVKEWFRRSREYAAQQDAAKASGGSAPAKNLVLEAMRPYIEKKLPVVISAEREAQIREALDWGTEMDVRVVILGGRDGWKLAERLAKEKIPVIVGSVHSLPLEIHDPYDAPYSNAGLLAAAGVPIAFRSKEPSLARNLPYEVGTAVAYGLPHETALRGLTIDAARILGVDRELGSIEPGKLADVIVTDGDPLEITTRVIYVFIGGRPVSLTSKREELYQKFKNRRTQRRAEL